jgi:hypothetical protein
MTFDTTINTRFSAGSSPHAGDNTPVISTNSEMNRMIFLFSECMNVAELPAQKPAHDALLTGIWTALRSFEQDSMSAWGQ